MERGRAKIYFQNSNADYSGAELDEATKLRVYPTILSVHYCHFEINVCCFALQIQKYQDDICAGVMLLSKSLQRINILTIFGAVLGNL
jgi:hypothetical protein